MLLVQLISLSLADGFDFLSTGGGATLEYITDEKINCFEDAL